MQLGQAREPLGAAYARILGVRPDADDLELARVAARLGELRMPGRDQTVRLLARCIRTLQAWHNDPRGSGHLEDYAPGTLTGPEVLGGMSLDALIACAIDLGLLEPAQAASAGYIDPKYGPIVIVLDDALDHLAAEVSYRIEGV